RQKEEIQHKNILLRESNMRLMMSQIRPHFIYNTLNAIYVLCGKEPERARKAIYDFSKYLRGNFEQMDRTEPVPFKEELQHVRFYVSIEQLRFPDALNVEYDIQEEDFSIPALTLQPLVENAVRHGIRATNRTGMIHISSFLENGEVCVAVEDDGEGFDVAEWEKNIRENGGEDESGRRHVGLANVRERIRKYGGDLLIESKKGVGTQMILCIRTP
ncbi:MAG: histidine kinase, partial [Lachnospiraceae bacterium]|nr:histidine kinase [Lachnospiraceae bacterium]